MSITFSVHGVVYVQFAVYWNYIPDLVRVRVRYYYLIANFSLPQSRVHRPSWTWHNNNNSITYLKKTRRFTMDTRSIRDQRLNPFGNTFLVWILTSNLRQARNSLWTLPDLMAQGEATRMECTCVEESPCSIQDQVDEGMIQYCRLFPRWK